jgi:hypothetical protein
MRLSLKDVETRIAPLGNRQSYDREFIFDLLLAYGRSPGNLTRLRSSSTSSLNVATDPTTEVAQKGVFYFKEFPEISEVELLAAIENLSAQPAVVRFTTRFVIVTDYRQLLAKDTKTSETLIIDIRDIANHFAFFLPWAGMEKAQYTTESHADVKAAERMAKLFDELLKENPEANQTLQGRHSLNIFFTRLLFCFFAEDTGIFAEGQFTKAVANLTQADGSDLHDFLGDLFIALDTDGSADKPKHMADFPYVNGRLFAVKSDQTVPVFNKKAREYLVESGKLQWGQINPDIFGSMFQAIVTPDQRADLGQHYTSVPNILKTIEPLFLDALKAEFDAAFDKEKKLEGLLKRIAQIKVFDPACGSGNFLIIAYKELRKLEHAMLERLTEISPKHQLLYAESHITIENFYGIELDDFAVEVAILSLWIAKHQMNAEFKHKFRIDIPLIPLKEMGQVKHGNAARIDWQTICPNDGTSEIYLIGNPPYAGSSMQSQGHKQDLNYAYRERSFSKNLDYISVWFIQGADYINDTAAELAFVTTNSVTQGEHVGLMFPLIFNMGLEIGYAYTSFKWENNARGNAGVTVAVINLRNERAGQKYLFVDNVRIEAKNVNGYLADAPSVYLSRASKPLNSKLPQMTRGSQPSDGGWLVVAPAQKAEIISGVPFSDTWLKRYVGSSEFINDKERYCLWVEDNESEEAFKNPVIAKRFEQVSAFRSDRNDEVTRDFAATPWKFKQPAYKATDAIIVPRVSSERRDYIPMGYLDKDTVVSDAAFAVYDAEPWVFALLTSRMHMVWTRAVAGALETRIRYSNTIVYNNFPVPLLSDAMKTQLTERALRVLDVREYHSELTLADLYDPGRMPDNLRLAHQQLDKLVDSIYRTLEFTSDEERLSILFGRYVAMIEAEDGK